MARQPCMQLTIHSPSRAYCNRSHEASVITSDEERVIWIPARLLMATRDPELYSFILDTVLRSGLLPAKLGAQAAARHWGLIYMSCSEQERFAVMAVLRAKAKQQQDVQAFLAVRGQSYVFLSTDVVARLRCWLGACNSVCHWCVGWGGHSQLLARVTGQPSSGLGA